MKKLFAATGAVAYFLLTGFILTLLLISIVEIEKDKLKEGARAQVYASIPAY